MKSNKLIAEFMGVKSYEASGYTNYVYSEDNHRPEVDLAYHEDWKRWLKPVVEKIDDYLFENVGKVGYFDECLSSNELDVTYQAVVDFIIWYNANKLNCEEFINQLKTK